MSAARSPDPIGDAISRARELLNGHDDAAAVRVAAALATWISAGDGTTLEMVLGVGETWRSARRRRRRDDLVMEICRSLPGKTARGRSRAAHLAISRYEKGAWKKDAAVRGRPGGVEGLIFDLLEICDAPALGSIREIRRIGGQP